MADEDQLKILRQGMTAWNAWRRKEGVHVNLGRANLREADLGAANLSRADLSRAYLCEASLIKANLGGADICGANLGGADFKLRDNRNIGDFRRWKNHDAYQKTLARLLRDLRVEPA